MRTRWVEAMWSPGRLSSDWRMRVSFVLVGAIFVICQLIVHGTRLPTEQAIAADRFGQGAGWSVMPTDPDGAQSD